MGAKRTADLIPLCHNIALSGVAVDVDVVPPSSSTLGRPTASSPPPPPPPPSSHPTSTPTTPTTSTATPPLPPPTTEEIGPHGSIVITATVKCFGQTGVEMEALTAATVAALTMYDMCKAVDKGMKVHGVRVLVKEGGRSGSWREGGGG